MNCALAVNRALMNRSATEKQVHWQEKAFQKLRSFSLKSTQTTDCCLRAMCL